MVKVLLLQHPALRWHAPIRVHVALSVTAAATCPGHDCIQCKGATL